MLRIKVLDERDLVAESVVTELVDQSPRQHDAEASLTESEIVADLDMPDWVLI